MFRSAGASRLSALLPLLCLVAFAGCRASKSLPKTYPVRGKAYTATGEALSGGVVHFRSESHPDLTITGAIQSDGTYSLKTARDSKQTEGAPEGTYQVTIVPLITTGHGGTPAILLQAPVTVATRDNQLDLRPGP